MKIFLKIVKFFFLFILLAAVFPYLICPFYKYPEIKPFSGNLFYNPYEKIDSTRWKKANFHAHSRQWSGITAGSSSPAGLISSAYKNLKYDIAAISDYQSINSFLSASGDYFPVYEHGYGIFKNHQLVIGAKQVSWKEYLFFQSFHNKQDVISSLRKNNEIISINHPKLRAAYSVNDLKYLRGYDVLEVASHSYFNAEDLWDSVLSAGNCIFVMAGDDNHNINNAEDYGYVYMMINAKSLKQEDILHSLRMGHSFGVELEPQKDTTIQKKIEQANSVPLVVSCKISGDTIAIKLNRSCDSLKLIGNNGELRAYSLNSDSINYKIKDNDTYIRPVINHNNSIRVFLNPLFRYNGEFKKDIAEIDLTKTWIYRLIYLIIITVIVWRYFVYKKDKQIIRRSN